MKSISILLGAIGVLALPLDALSAEEKAPTCDCDCPSIEEQVQERLAEYKSQLDAEVKELKDKLSDQLNKERVDELQNKLEQLFDEMLRDFRKEEPSKPTETLI